MFLLGFRRKLTALALCKSIESAIQWFQIHHRITFATIQNATVYLSGARVSIFSTLVPRLSLKIDFVSANSSGPDEMPPHSVAFHLGLHCSKVPI